ncbi:hypothetical protein RRG08_000457 [Elysia crispata]|uniref:Uncharacterized protein n=1 Tax=Elysia crispata TaxID=231223 RepID=A0AAE1CW84_9GAST|nr:hypothetical protein RRG08_000457 [Elysia crispata]
MWQYSSGMAVAIIYHPPCFKTTLRILVTILLSPHLHALPPPALPPACMQMEPPIVSPCPVLATDAASSQYSDGYIRICLNRATNSYLRGIGLGVNSLQIDLGFPGLVEVVRPTSRISHVYDLLEPDVCPRLMVLSTTATELSQYQ